MVEQWIEFSEENAKIARQIQLLVLASDTADVLEQVDVEKALSKTHHRIVFNKVSRLFRYVEKAAVILLIPLLAVMFTYFNNEDVNQDKVTVSCNPGTITKITLPDGTIAHLNANSNLSYPSKFTGEFRAVELEGEAFFEVTKNPEQPFIVNLKNHNSIEVRGTSFNVQANDNDVITTLVEGKVRFHFLSNNGIKQSVDLNPGQSLRYGFNDHQFSLYSTNCTRETCWKEGWIIFDNTPVNEVLDLLSRKFSVDFIVRNPECQNFSFTGSFKDHRLEQILDCFAFSSNIKWRYIIDSNNKSTRSQIEIIFKE